MTKLLKENPIDWQILGIGQNGHIGFNEPGTPAEITTQLLTFKKAQSKPTHVSLNQKQMYHVKQFQWDLLQL